MVLARVARSGRRHGRGRAGEGRRGGVEASDSGRPFDPITTCFGFYEEVVIPHEGSGGGGAGEACGVARPRGAKVAQGSEHGGAGDVKEGPVGVPRRGRRRRRRRGRHACGAVHMNAAGAAIPSTAVVQRMVSHLIAEQERGARAADAARAELEAVYARPRRWSGRRRRGGAAGRHHRPDGARPWRGSSPSAVDDVKPARRRAALRRERVRRQRGGPHALRARTGATVEVVPSVAEEASAEALSATLGAKVSAAAAAARAPPGSSSSSSSRVGS